MVQNIKCCGKLSNVKPLSVRHTDMVASDTPQNRFVKLHKRVPCVTHWFLLESKQNDVVMSSTNNNITLLTLLFFSLHLSASCVRERKTIPSPSAVNADI